MGRTKIEINVSTLGQRTKTMNMIVGSNTTAADVIRKVLEKFRLQDPQTMYQLLAVRKMESGSQGICHGVGLASTLCGVIRAGPLGHLWAIA